MKRKRLTIFAVMLSCILSLAAAKDADTLIGFWRTVKTESSDSKYQNPSGELEMQFAEGGVVTVKMRDSAGGAGKEPAQIIKGKFTLTSTDRIAITFDGVSAQDRYRYSFKDGQLVMAHMDYPVMNTLKRLKAFSF